MNQLTKFRRLDKQLVEQGLVATTARAQELIQSGAVRVNGAVITAIQCPIYDDHQIEISGIDCPWVSPDALKLFEALDAIKLDVKGRTAVDIGAGAGGFEDVLIQKGAKKIYAIDKESALLHHSLSLNPRIKNLQRTIAKDLKKEQLDTPFDLIVSEIPTAELAESLVPVISYAEQDFDLLAFCEDKKLAKDIEKNLRLDHAMMLKKVPDTFQKKMEAQGLYLMWLQKKI